MTVPQDPPTALEPEASPPRVILVDDPPSAQRLLRAVLDCVTALEPEASPLRVILVDDAPSTRRLLRAVLDCVTALEVVAEADSGSQAIESAKRLGPDVILLDLSLPDADGAQILPDLLRVAPDARVIILSQSARSAGPELVAAGAAGFIEKGLPPYALVDQLSTVLGLPLTVVSDLPEP